MVALMYAQAKEKTYSHNESLKQSVKSNSNKRCKKMYTLYASVSNLLYIGCYAIQIIPPNIVL